MIVTRLMMMLVLHTWKIVLVDCRMNLARLGVVEY
jgi:hypothetical protein